MLKSFLVWMVKMFIFSSFFAPLIVGGSFYFPYIVPKTVFFQIVAELALFFYILLIVVDKSYAPKWDLLAKSALAFFGVYAIAGIFGANPERSFFGSYERMLGVINVAHFIALFFVVRAVFISTKDWVYLFRAFLFASSLVGLYGLGQWLNLSFLYHAGAGRIDATIGNPAFVAGYFIFAAFFSIFALLKDSNQGFKYFYIFSLILSIWAAYASATRGGLLGLVVAAIIIFIAYFLQKERKSVFKKEFLLTGAVIALSIFGLAFFTGGKGAFFAPIGRLAGISLSDTTTNTRILAAKSSWEGFLARPILGWGPQNYNLVFDKYYNPKIYPMENWFDHAHSIIFDTLVATGAVGFIIYLFFFGTVVFYCFRFARANGGNYWLGVFGVALMAAYFTQNIFVFDSLVTYLSFFVFIAFVGANFSVGAGGGETAVAAKNVKNAKSAKRPSSAGELPIATVVMLSAVFAVGGYWFSVRPALGAYWAVQALMVNPADTGTVIDYFKKSFSYGTATKNSEIAGRVADSAIQLLGNDKIDQAKKKEFFDFAYQETKKAVEENPLDFRNYLYHASFLHQSGSFLGSGDNTLLNEADKVLANAEKLAPQKQLLYLEWGRVKSKLDDQQGAVDKFEKAFNLNPEALDSKLSLAAAYLRANIRDKALPLFEEILGKEPALNARQYISLADGFAQLGSKDKAIVAARKVAELDPSLKQETDNFINRLEGR